MQARSSLFDLYGDHLRRRSDDYCDRAPVAALVRLLAPLGITAPAVRTAVSRTVRQGWLEPVRLPVGPGYALTPRAVRRLDDTTTRVYRTLDTGWDGCWHLLTLRLPSDRSARERVTSGLAFLGYGPLDPATWLSPRACRGDDVDALLSGEGVRAERFEARHDGDSHRLVARAWDLDGLARSYRRFLSEADGLLPAAGQADPEQAFATRCRLVHSWRKFLFTDPQLPRELLPQLWAGDEAAAYFDAHANLLLPAATAYVDSCLEVAH